VETQQSLWQPSLQLAAHRSSEGNNPATIVDKVVCYYHTDDEEEEDFA